MNCWSKFRKHTWNVLRFVFHEEWVTILCECERCGYETCFAQKRSDFNWSDWRILYAKTAVGDGITDDTDAITALLAHK